MGITQLDFWAGRKTGTADLPDLLTNCKVHPDIVHRVVRWQLARRRSGTHLVKGRSDVKISKRKIYRQKGTGGARHAARSANIFRGGGRVFGPVLRSHAHALPKRLRLQGIVIALYDKSLQGNLYQLATTTPMPAAPKTAATKKILEDCNLKKPLLLVKQDELLGYRRATNNLAHCDVLPTIAVNVYDIIKHHSVIVSESLWSELAARHDKIVARRNGSNSIAKAVANS